MAGQGKSRGLAVKDISWGNPYFFLYPLGQSGLIALTFWSLTLLFNSEVSSGSNPLNYNAPIHLTCAGWVIGGSACLRFDIEMWVQFKKQLLDRFSSTK